jgi:septal ring factor EnvC (AmiA/AmiB activator)
VDVAKMVSEQFQKQMAKQNAKIQELEESFWEQKRMAYKLNGNLNEFERQLKSIQDQQGTMVVVRI